MAADSDLPVPETSRTPSEPLRPQVDVGPATSPGGAEPGEAVGSDPEPTQHGGDVPALFAMADDDAEPRSFDPPAPRPLTERIIQGRPSYSEPDPQIAGVIGRAATGDGRQDD